MKTIKRLLPYFKGSKKLAAISLLCALISTGSKLTIPFLAGKAVDVIYEASQTGSAADISFHLIMMGILLILGTVFRYVFDYLVALIGQRVIKEMRRGVFHSYLYVPVKTIDEKKKGDLVTRLINDEENVQNGLVSGFASFYDGIIAIGITLVFMFTLHWALGLIVVFLTPISIFVSRFISRFNSKHFKEQAKASGQVGSYVLESLTNSEAVASYDLEEDREEAFASLNSSYQEHQFKANMGASIINPSTRLVNALINALLILVGAIFLIEDIDLGVAFSVGALSSFLTYASNYMQPFNDISNVASEIEYALSSFARIDEATHYELDKDDGNEELKGDIAEISAKGVTFSYDGERIITNNLNLQIHKGMKVAFVGPTGCGKTTIINLLMRFYDPQEGSFYLNDVSTLNMKKSSLRKRVGMVLQETWVFKGTVRENIAYGKRDATLEEIKEAAKKARADRFIERLPQGYDTIISDSSGLSMGEKQLLCVSRLMLLEPEVVILDEATSNIDVRTESLLNASFSALLEGRTSLVVAHRLSTIVNSDLIVVLNSKGGIEEQGTHKELLDKGAFYAKLYKAQFS